MRITLAVLVSLLLAGCGSSYDDPLSTPKRQANPGAFGVALDSDEPAPAAAEPAGDQSDQPAKKKDQGEADTAAKRDAPNKATNAKKEADQVPDDVVREKATVGVGEKGSGYGGGIITTPVSVYFRAQERIIFDAQIPHEVQLYKALHGKVPQTFEEFQKEIIDPARIDLPRLPAGHKYIWDPKEEQLMVEQPKK